MKIGTEWDIIGGIHAVACSPGVPERFAIAHSQGKVVICGGFEETVSLQRPYFMKREQVALIEPDPIHERNLMFLEGLSPTVLQWSDGGNFLGVGYEDSSYLVVDVRSGAIVFERRGVFKGEPRQLKGLSEEAQEWAREALFGGRSLAPEEQVVTVGKHWRPNPGPHFSVPSYRPLYLSEEHSLSVIEMKTEIAGVTWPDGNVRWSIGRSEREYADAITGGSQFVLVDRISRQCRIFGIDKPNTRDPLIVALPSPNDGRDHSRVFFESADQAVFVVQLRDGPTRASNSSLIISDLLDDSKKTAEFELPHRADVLIGAGLIGDTGRIKVLISEIGVGIRIVEVIWK